MDQENNDRIAAVACYTAGRAVAVELLGLGKIKELCLVQDGVRLESAWNIQAVDQSALPILQQVKTFVQFIMAGRAAQEILLGKYFEAIDGITAREDFEFCSNAVGAGLSLGLEATDSFIDDQTQEIRALLSTPDAFTKLEHLYRALCENIHCKNRPHLKIVKKP